MSSSSSSRASSPSAAGRVGVLTPAADDVAAAGTRRAAAATAEGGAAPRPPAKRRKGPVVRHPFAPSAIHLMQCKRGEAPAPDPLLEGVRFAAGTEVANTSMVGAKVVFTGGMSGLTLASGSSAQKKEAERRCVALGGNKWQSAVNGKTTILVVGPRKYWKCSGKKTQAAKLRRANGSSISLWTSSQLARYLEAKTL